MDLNNDFRPNNINDMVGQKDIVELFSKFIKSKKIPHSLFFGATGCGKTTMAKIIAKQMNYEFFELDGANLKSEDIRKIISKFETTLYKPLIFIDEFHRLSKTQQETLLIPMEKEKCIIMGATTENPKFVVSSGIRSRMMIFEFKPLSHDELTILLTKVQNVIKFEITNEAKDYLINSSGGDARSLLNLLEFALSADKSIGLNILKTLRSHRVSEGVSNSDTHYELTSALIKSLRGSDIDASIYYLARLIQGGEEPAFLARRMVIFASEDIGNANPNALNLATNVMLAVSKIGYPEARIILAQCAVYLASSPKSNSSYKAINDAIEFVENRPALPVPKYLINTDKAKSEYLYPHDFGGWVEQKYMSTQVKFYKSNAIGFEKTLDEWITKLKESYNEKI
ncbi:replication-associated recombination protein A [Campylobacter fetus]|uniref:replication-associated recombination protein A n=1 Tax=Campylobacter fetus TaxID=196 RepID=UPI0005091145|nr:replication-associated recombination protein A [Campylobacter fetus]WKW17355.1 replication-associated recombination protein A [Campylobacter fetus subsp. fetus]AIR79617.1 recombination factor protein RarA [Campylobacter fetus subsp. fetus 04/554]EAJ5693799.1 replication-associated recombination protein A [Campylobacter fetus]EAJ5704223.1 replication-associated recombination protein A [Campylobacter fetus]EAJ9256941.1 replication-associated recombination protein A [Campylobacter fetus]